MLVTYANITNTFPVYLNKASKTTDPVERLKLVMTANFSYFFYAQRFEKPLNPILGETFQAYAQDGSKIFMEQTAHHPPRTHLIIEGPDNNFYFHGYLEFAIYAGLQNASMTCAGFKEITFPDGGKIRWDQNGDYFSGIFMGTMGHQMTGTITFTDEANNLTGTYQYGAYNFRKQDFCWGEIK